MVEADAQFSSDTQSTKLLCDRKDCHIITFLINRSR